MNGSSAAFHANGSTSSVGGTLRSRQPASRDPNHLMVKSATNVVYYVGEKLGGGNFGIVHNWCVCAVVCSRAVARAHDHARSRDAFDRDFVIKVIRQGRKKEELEADWQKEVQFLYSLNHPNIVRLFDAFSYNDQYYMGAHCTRRCCLSHLSAECSDGAVWRQCARLRQEIRCHGGMPCARLAIATLMLCDRDLL
jgi:serine/threonine protein kinase